jgi:hypothetical protein|tara:strand:+ start:152 stop:520 length:369 start_codon:yes stop_codon:yes gene_type:complete
VFGGLSYESIESDQRRFLRGCNKRIDRLQTKSSICDTGQGINFDKSYKEYYLSEERIKELIGELVGELEKTEAVGEDTLGVVRQLESDVHDFVNPEVESTENTILDDVVALEASFAATHPVA